MQIRPLLPDEIEPCRSLVRSVFDRFEAPDYSREGIASFYAFLDSVPEQFNSGRWSKRRRISPGKTGKNSLL